jgi:hypothetical protein
MTIWRSETNALYKEGSWYKTENDELLVEQADVAFGVLRGNMKNESYSAASKLPESVSTPDLI